ncbi:hypothetical protein ACLOJK_035437 [Asimina triloba]
MLVETQKLHAFLLKTGLQNDIYRGNRLLRAYTQCNAFSHASIFLKHMPRPNVVSYNTLLSAYVAASLTDEALQLFSAAPETDTCSWNILISGFARAQKHQEAMGFFAQMIRRTARPDNYTYATVVPCCDWNDGVQVHAQIIKSGWNWDVFVGTNVVRMYVNVGEVGDAWKVFDEMPNRDLVSWNALISCCSKMGMGGFGLELFRVIAREGMRLDEYSFSTVLNEFASRSLVFEGMHVHGLVVRSGFCFDQFTCNALLNFYCKCGWMASAARLFEEMPEHDVVSWTAMIVGLVQNGWENDAMQLFDQMLFANVKPNSFTFGGLLNACASAGSLARGKRYHGLVLKFGLETDVVLGSAMVDMYSKNGELDSALRLFCAMPERDIVCWNAIICGFSQNGRAIEALKLFNDMLQKGSIRPNHVTFVGILNACGHAGLILEGCRYFNDMISKYNIAPKFEHYTCVVDILARAGLLEEAEDFILALPFEPDNGMWGALLAACKRCGNLAMANCIAKRLFADEPDNSSSYVLLANMYTSVGEWGGASEVRGMMDASGVQKMAGSSWIEIQNYVHSFVSGCKDHPQIESIYEALQRLCLHTNDVNA